MGNQPTVSTKQTVNAAPGHIAAGDKNSFVKKTILVCSACDEEVTADDKSTHANSCQQWRLACPHLCGAIIRRNNISLHLLECPLERVECPNRESLGCTTACKGRLRRKDVDAHLADPRTVSAIVGHLTKLINRASEQGEDFNQNSTARAAIEALGMKRKRPEQDGAEDEKILVSEVIGNEFVTSWKQNNCPDSQAILEEQLNQRKVVEGEAWTTYHIAYEFDSKAMISKNRFAIASPAFDIRDGVEAQIQADRNMEETGPDTGINFYIGIEGFCGKVDYTITVFRFGRGAPKQKTEKMIRVDGDLCYGLPFFDMDDLAHGGWLVTGRKLPILVTLHLNH